MPNGRPHDNPLTDTLKHGMHPFPREIEILIRKLHEVNSDRLNLLEWAPFSWVKREDIEEAKTLLEGLIDNHSDSYKCKQLINTYLSVFNFR